MLFEIKGLSKKFKLHLSLSIYRDNHLMFTLKNLLILHTLFEHINDQRKDLLYLSIEVNFDNKIHFNLINIYNELLEELILEE